MAVIPVEKKDKRAQEEGFNTWEDWVDYIEKHEENGRSVCGAWANKSEDSKGIYDSPRPCRGIKINPAGRCKQHGGMSPRGAAHPSWQGKGFSKDIPTKLLKRFVRAVEDPEITSMVSHIALLDSRLGDLMEKIETAESQARWDLINECVEGINKELHKDNPDINVVMEFTHRLKEALEADRYELQVWDDIKETIEQRRKITEAERRREEQLEANLTARQTATIISALQLAIEQEAPPEIQRRIASRMRNILYGPDGRGDPEDLELLDG